MGSNPRPFRRFLFQRDLLFLFLLASFAGAATPPKVTSVPAPRRVLFVGNSLVASNEGIHVHLKKLAASDPLAGAELVTGLIARGGAALADHGTELAAALRPRTWDLVVLQGQSTEPIDPGRAARFREAVRLSSDLARASGARAALFMTWGFADQPGMTRLLSESAVGAGNDAGILVLPVGLAFERSRAERPRLAVHTPDNVHPSLAGTYLATCVVYAALFGRSAEGLSYTARLAREDAAFLQRVAWETVRTFIGSDPP